VNLLLPGVYVAAESPIHRLDPRVKMAAALLMTVLPFSVEGPVPTLILWFFVTSVVLLARAPIPALLRTLRTVFWLGLFMFVFYLFTTPGEPLVTVGPVAMTWEGLVRAGTQILRLCFLVIVAALLTYTTSPSQLTHGLDAVLGPLDRLGLPVRELGMVLTIALRFVPVFADEIDKITKSQRARGGGIDAGGLRGRLQGVVAIFVPVFVAAFRRSEALATAMEARGFRSARHRTRFRRLRLTYWDLVAALITIATGLSAFALNQP
jgi:energy-coupling factor transport system permease protein